MKKILYLFLVILSYSEINAQDPVFTQFYDVPMMMNPAFAGSKRNIRAGLGYRSQWMRSDYNVSTFYASADKFMEMMNSGLGIMILNQHEAVSGYNFLEIRGSYAYHLELSDELTFFPGFSVSYAFKQFDFSDLIFGDQIDISTGGISDSTNDPVNLNENVRFLDLSVGGVFYFKEAWLGASLRHLTKPDISFADQEKMNLEMFLSVHGGYRFSLYNYGRLPEDSYIFVTANYMKQGVFNRYDLGGELKLSGFTVGTLVSGSVQKLTSDSQFVFSVNPVIGLELEKFKLGIAYDFPVGAYSTVKGTGEITFQYFIKNPERKRRIWQRK